MTKKINKELLRKNLKNAKKRNTNYPTIKKISTLIANSNSDSDLIYI